MRQAPCIWPDSFWIGLKMEIRSKIPREKGVFNPEIECRFITAECEDKCWILKRN